MSSRLRLAPCAEDFSSLFVCSLTIPCVPRLVKDDSTILPFCTTIHLTFKFDLFTPTCVVCPLRFGSLRNVAFVGGSGPRQIVTTILTRDMATAELPGDRHTASTLFFFVLGLTCLGSLAYTLNAQPRPPSKPLNPRQADSVLTHDTCYSHARATPEQSSRSRWTRCRGPRLGSS